MTNSNRTYEMNHIANTIDNMVHMFNTHVPNVAIYYEKMTDESIKTYTDWQRTYNHLLTGEEYFIIWDGPSLLYAVNVSGDSALTAAEELMHLVASKF